MGVASMDGACYVLDAALGSALYQFRGHQGEVNALDFQPLSANDSSQGSLSLSLSLSLVMYIYIYIYIYIYMYIYIYI